MVLTPTTKHEAAQIDAPLGLASFFPDSDSENDADENGSDGEFDQCFETQTVELRGESLLIRQYAFHSHNANRVWPGTFNLLNYLLEEKEGGGESSIEGKPIMYKKNWGSVLELGTATGVLAIRLAMACASNSNLLPDEENKLNFACNDIVTSDVDDEYGEVQENVRYNFGINNFHSKALEDEGDSSGVIPPHVTHTWGTGWRNSATQCDLENKKFDTIVASDILLYVSAYDALVTTLLELFSQKRDLVFVMSWNRRMKESAKFFELIERAGFTWTHEGKCIYTIVKERS